VGVAVGAPDFLLKLWCHCAFSSGGAGHIN
jgi:hypothetical protein